MNIEVRQLRTFVAVAEDLHFGKAAAHLGVSQSTVSEQVRGLERALGAELFLRTSRTVALTAAGDVLLSGATRVLAELGELESRVGAVAAGRLGALRIGAVGPAMADPMPELLRMLHDELPGVEIAVSSLSTTAALRELENGSLDIALVRSIRPLTGFRLEQVSDEPLVAILPAHHPLAAESELDLSQLDGEDFIFWPRISNPELYDLLIATCYRFGCSPRRVVESSDMYTQLAIISAGMGVSVQPASFQGTRRDDVAFLPLRGPLPRMTLQVAWVPQNHAPTTRAVVSVVRRFRAGVETRIE